MVRRTVFFCLLVLVGLMAVMSPVYAASVTDALYVADVVVQNTGEEASDVVVTCPVNTQALLDGKYVSDDLLNTALQSLGGSDIPYMPGVGSNPWCLWCSSINANEQKGYSLFAGGPAMQTGLWYFPGSGGMGASDSTSLELGDDFAIEQKGYFNTYGGSEILRPNAEGDETNLAVHPMEGPPPWIENWDCVDEEEPDGSGTYVWEYSSDYLRDLYNLPPHSGSGTIDSIEVWARAAAYIDPDQPSLKIAIKIDGTVYEGDAETLTESWGNFSEEWSENPSTSTAWSWDDMDDLQIGVALRSCNSETNNKSLCTQLYVKVNATSDKRLVFKNGALRIYVNAIGEITAEILYSSSSDDEILRPNAAGDEESINYATSGAGNHWQDVDDITPDDGSTVVSTTNTTYQRDLYNLPAHSEGSGTINYIKVYFRCYWGYQGTGYAKPSIKSDGTVTDGTEVNPPNAWTTYSEQWNTNPADGQAWEWADIDDLQIGVALKGDGVHGTSCTQVDVVINYSPSLSKSVTATGVSSGEHTVEVTADGTDLKIYVDDVEKDSEALAGASVLDNDNDWVFLTAGSMPYMEYHKIWVEDELRQYIVYERDTVFDDLSAYNNDATPTFCTASTDPDVSASLENFRPINEADCTAGAEEETPEMLTGVPEVPPELYGEEGGGVGHLPGAEVTEAMLGYGGIPSDLFWILLCYGGAALAVIISYGFIRSSLLFPTIIGFVIILFFSLASGGDPIPLWTIFPYAIISGGLLVSERVLGW